MFALFRIPDPTTSNPPPPSPSYSRLTLFVGYATLHGNHFEPFIIGFAGQGIIETGIVPCGNLFCRSESRFLNGLTAGDAEARIARALRLCVGNHLREIYGEVLKESLPPRIADLMHRLDH